MVATNPNFPDPPRLSKRSDADISADEVMRRYPKMAFCASILIEACQKTTEGRRALIEWNQTRRI